jgi:DNA-binding transcriptional regulator YdaS (Cro superfamily)
MKLSDYLQREKMTQAQFAELVGAHPITVNKWATGSAMPRRALAAKIHEATRGQVTAADLAAAFAAQPQQAA